MLHEGTSELRHHGVSVYVRACPSRIRDLSSAIRLVLAAFLVGLGQCLVQHCAFQTFVAEDVAASDACTASKGVLVADRYIIAVVFRRTLLTCWLSTVGHGAVR